MPPLPVVGAAAAVGAAMWAGIIYAGYKVWDHPVGNTALRTAWRVLVPG